VSEQARLDVLGFQRLPQQRIVEQVYLSNRKIVGGTPISVEARQFLLSQYATCCPLGCWFLHGWLVKESMIALPVLVATPDAHATLPADTSTMFKVGTRSMLVVQGDRQVRSRRSHEASWPFVCILHFCTCCGPAASGSRCQRIGDHGEDGLIRELVTVVPFSSRATTRSEKAVAAGAGRARSPEFSTE
jgi:hypothetical protein